MNLKIKQIRWYDAIHRSIWIESKTDIEWGIMWPNASIRNMPPAKAFAIPKEYWSLTSIESISYDKYEHLICNMIANYTWEKLLFFIGMIQQMIFNPVKRTCKITLSNGSEKLEEIELSKLISWIELRESPIKLKENRIIIVMFMIKAEYWYGIRFRYTSFYRNKCR